MPHLLAVETSPRGALSVSRQLTRRFVADWQAAHPQGAVTVRDLAAAPLPALDGPWIEAALTPLPQQTPAMQARLRTSDQLVAELLQADHLLVATPVHNYNVPASLKAWVDHIVRKGLTLGAEGQGLLQGRRATVLIASGGVYTEGSPIRDRDIATQYLRLMLGVLGITDVQVVAGGGAKNVDLGVQRMDAFVDGLAPEIARAAGR